MVARQEQWRGTRKEEGEDVWKAGVTASEE
jgi:hypothetical protein